MNGWRNHSPRGTSPAPYPVAGFTWSGGAVPDNPEPASFAPGVRSPHTRSGRLPSWQEPQASGPAPLWEQTPDRPSFPVRERPTFSWADRPISRAELGRATGRGLKVRILLVVSLLVLLPAITLVLVFQNASRAAAASAGTERLRTAAAAEAAGLQAQFTQFQATAAGLSRDPTVVQLGQTPGSGAPQRAVEALLAGASAASPGSFGWMLLDRSDVILASSTPLWDAQPLARLSAFKDPAHLEAVLQSERLSRSPQTGPAVLASGLDAAVPGTGWLAVTAWLTPSNRADSAGVLALFSLDSLLPVLPAVWGRSGVALLLDSTGTLLAVQGNRQMTASLGKPIPIAALKQQAQHPDGSLVDYLSASGQEQTGLGVPCGPSRWTCLVAADTSEVLPAPTGLLSSQNTLLEVLFLFVLLTLIITAAATPVVHPIRRATRQLTIAFRDIRILKEDNELNGEDQETAVFHLGQAARGAMERNASLLQQSIAVRMTYRSTAQPLVDLAWLVAELPQTHQALANQIMGKTREIYSGIEDSDQQMDAMMRALYQNASPARLEQIRVGIEAFSQSASANRERFQQAVDRLQSVEQVIGKLASGN